MKNKAYQMSELEYRVFIEHCKSTETYRRGVVRKFYHLEEPSGEMALEDFDRYIDSENVISKNGEYYDVETKRVRIKGYNKEAEISKENQGIFDFYHELKGANNE